MERERYGKERAAVKLWQHIFDYFINNFWNNSKVNNKVAEMAKDFEEEKQKLTKKQKFCDRYIGLKESLLNFISTDVANAK